MHDETADLFNALLALLTIGGSLAVEGFDELTGIAFSRSVGQAGEDAVGITGPKVGIRVPGTNQIRFPDGLTLTTLTEVKNVASQGLTQQIQDDIIISQSTERTFVLWVRPSTVLSDPLKQAIINKQIILNYIPGAK